MSVKPTTIRQFSLFILVKRCSDFVRTSVPVNAIEQRVSRLGQFINEANWRFQLVSWNDGTGSQKSRKDRKSTRKANQALVSGERSTEEEGQDEASDGTPTKRKSGKMLLLF